MNIDFEFLLVLVVVVTGIVTLLDVLVLRRRREAREPESGGDGESTVREPIWVEYSKAFFPVLLIVLLLRSFFMEPFRIPSGSMTPTLVQGDFILVNKFTYGLRLPLVHSKFLPLGEPERGDVVVFRFPEDPRIDYIKRVVGVPGDRVRYDDKALFLNGERVPHEFVGTYDGAYWFGARIFREYLPGAEHNILVRPQRNVAGEVVVPDGHYFVMGDNRDASKDSRIWGFVPEENLVGRAVLVWMSWDFGGAGLMLERIGNQID